MAKLKDLVGKFVLRTTPIENNYKYSSTGKTFPIFVESHQNNQIMFKELKKKSFTKKFSVENSILDLKKIENNNEDLKLCDGHWMPVGNFIEYSKFVGKELMSFSDRSKAEKTFSLFERGNLMFCITQNMSTRELYRLFIINKKDYSVQDIEYGSGYSATIEKLFYDNKYLKEKVTERFCTKKGFANLMSLTLRDVYYDIPLVSFKYAITPVITTKTQKPKVVILDNDLNPNNQL